MLPSRYRLRKKSDFARVLKNGQSRNSRCLALRFVDNGNSFSRLRTSLRENLNSRFTRIGLLASKKFFKKASQRNYVKRKLREAARLNLSRINPGWDIIFMARAGLEKKTLKETEATILSLLEEAGLVKDNKNEF